jgi:hypothetical protein
MAQAARLQRPQPRPTRPRYYSVIGGRGYWQPGKRLRALGFCNVACGDDSPEARAIAEAMNRRATAARLTADAARAVADASSSSAVYDMLGAFTEVNAEHLYRMQSEKFELQTVEYWPPVPTQSERFETQILEYGPPVRLQTRPPLSSLVGRLRAALHTMFHATRR